MWLNEKLTSSTKNNLKFGNYCLQGAIVLPEDKILPPYLMKLLVEDNTISKEFKSSIRFYNSILSFTSMSINVDQALLQATTGLFLKVSL